MVLLCRLSVSTHTHTHNIEAEGRGRGERQRREDEQSGVWCSSSSSRRTLHKDVKVAVAERKSSFTCWDLLYRFWAVGNSVGKDEVSPSLNGRSCHVVNNSSSTHLQQDTLENCG